MIVEAVIVGEVTVEEVTVAVIGEVVAFTEAVINLMEIGIKETTIDKEDIKTEMMVAIKVEILHLTEVVANMIDKDD